MVIYTYPLRKKKFARSDVGERARPCRLQRLCELAGCDVAQAASSMVAALLLLLVANVLTDFFMLWICGATLHQSTGTNAACQQALVLAAITNSPFMLRRMRQYSLGESTVERDANAAPLAQPALGLLLQGSTSWLHSELTYVFGTWRISSSSS